MDIPDRSEMTVDELLERYRSGERNFSNTELPDGVSLRGVVLAGAIFDDGWRDGIDFTSAALSGASFQRAHLKLCVFDHANLTGADLRESAIDGATFKGAHLDGARFGGASAYGGSLKDGEQP